MGRIANRGGTVAGKEAAHPLLLVYVACGAGQRRVRVQVGLVADLEDGQGHEQETGKGAGKGAREQIGRVGELREGRGRRVSTSRRRGRGGEGEGRRMLADGAQGRKVDGGAKAGAQGRGHGAAPKGGDGIGRTGDLANGGAYRLRARLLHARLEQVDGLEEDGAQGAGAQPGYEVEGLL